MFCCYVVEKCEVLFDVKFGDCVLIKFMNNLMIDGKKLVVECIVYLVFDCVQSKLKCELIEVFYEVFDNVKFLVEVCLCCVGGVIYQVLVEVCLICCEVLVICWLIDVLKKCNEYMMEECFVGELVDVVNGCGIVVKKCEDIYKMVDVNKVFSYYCW